MVKACTILDPYLAIKMHAVQLDMLMFQRSIGQKWSKSSTKDYLELKMNNIEVVSVLTPKEERMKIYRLWLEKGWWTLDEAVCVFLNHSPDTAYNYEAGKKIIKTKLGEYIYLNASKAVMTRSIDIIYDDGPNRASCKNWIEWAKQYPLIQLDPILIKEFNAMEKQRPNESYRPEEERKLKVIFQSAAKILLQICPNARLEDLRKVIIESKVTEELPTDRTLREWLKSEQIELRQTKPSGVEVLEIQKKLFSSFQPFTSSRGSKST